MVGFIKLALCAIKNSKTTMLKPPGASSAEEITQDDKWQLEDPIIEV
jgi:hypothetical protein